MISIDTNVLLRYLLQDDPAHSPKANALFERGDLVLITDVVIVETIWTLRGSKYGLEKAELVEVLEGLFKEPNVVFEDGQSVWRALHNYRLAQPVKVGSKKKSADFADAMIIEKSKYDCEQKGRSLEGVYTFDVAAREIDGAIEL